MSIIWLCPQEGGKLKFERKKSNKICYFIDDFNLPVNTMVRLKKDYGPSLEYRLVPVDNSGTEVYNEGDLFFSRFFSRMMLI